MSDPVISALAQLTGKLVFEFLKQRPSGVAPILSDLEGALARTLSQSFEWASQLQMYPMGRPLSLPGSTIPLRMSEMPRRFHGAMPGVEQDEVYVARDSRRVVLLGDPGSGKTTSLKRIVYRVISGDLPIADEPVFPVVIRLRELEPSETLVGRIAAALGIEGGTRVWRPEDGRVTGAMYKELWYGTELLKNTVADFLRAHQVFLVIDGLDESSLDQVALRRELEWLSLTAAGSKILLSCRSGEYFGGLEGFEVLEICPLSRIEADQIVSLSGVNASDFYKALDKTPYGDLSDRPLFLCQLLVIFGRQRYLPLQPTDVYRDIVMLLLRDWDADRNIVRKSRYAYFTPDRKLAFLAALSYQLTHRIKAKHFSQHDLAQAYSKIHVRFALPAEDAAQVIQEVESHAGIVVKAGSGRFEFSHLSLQEYLCAEYMSRETHSSHLKEYLESYPNPVAVSIALASDSALALAALFLKNAVPPVPSALTLLRRLKIEAPAFDPHPALGVALLRMLDQYASSPEVLEVILSITSLQGAIDSIRLAMDLYEDNTREDDERATRRRLKRTSQFDDVPGIKAPESLVIPQDVFSTLIAICSKAPRTYIEYTPRVPKRPKRRVQIGSSRAATDGDKGA
jgi:hypothetical protein